MTPFSFQWFNPLAPGHFFFSRATTVATRRQGVKEIIISLIRVCRHKRADICTNTRQQWKQNKHMSPSLQSTSIQLINPFHSNGKFSGQIKQSARLVHSCLVLAILIKISTNNPGHKSVVLESSSLAVKTWYNRRFKNHCLRVQNHLEWLRLSLQ